MTITSLSLVATGSAVTPTQAQTYPVIYNGTWDASANMTNPLTGLAGPIVSGAGIQGTAYKVSVAGTTNIDGNAGWSLHDYIVFNGSTWDKLAGSALTFGTTAGTMAQGNDARIVGALQAANNLSELSASAATARANLNAQRAWAAPSTVSGTFSAAAFGIYEVDLSSVNATANLSSTPSTDDQVMFLPRNGNNGQRTLTIATGAGYLIEGATTLVIDINILSLVAVFDGAKWIIR